jgi:hypothetical protein
MRQAKSDLRDARGGAYDADTSETPRQPTRMATTDYQRAQGGADGRSMPDTESPGVPEGLERERKGPLGPQSGRRKGNT